MAGFIWRIPFLDLKGEYEEYHGDYRLYGPFAALKMRW